MDSRRIQDWAAGRTERRLTTSAIVGLVLSTIAIAPFATHPVGTSLPFLAMTLAATVVSTAVAAYLLFVQGRAQNSVATSVLAAGFASATLTFAMYTLVWQGLFDPIPALLHATIATSGWLWVSWHDGLLAGILSFHVLRNRPGDGSPRSGRRVMLAFAIAWIIVTVGAIVGNPPSSHNGPVWSPIYLLIGVPLMAVPAAIALIITRRRSDPTVLDLGLTIVCASMVADIVLTLLGTQRYTLGWYASRVDILFGVSALLAVLLLQAARMYAQVVARAESLDSAAHTDILTNLPNRRRFEEELTRAFGAASRRNAALSLAMLDIDRFKRYNDTFGHQAGDEALRKIGAAVARSVERSGDFVARYGGEEFVIIFEDTDLAGALAVTERVSIAVLAENIAAPNGGVLSISGGVAQRAENETAESLLRRADVALYAAKETGRNRVIAAQIEREAVPASH